MVMLETASKISACEIAIVYSSKIIGFKLDNKLLMRLLASAL